MSTREQDRLHAVRYSEAETQLRAFARHYRALMGEVTVDPALHTFGPTVAVHLRNTYDDLASYLTAAADQAAELGTQYREHLGATG
jgi:hypothetical protein